VAATTAVAPPPEEARPADPEISPSPPSASVALPAAGKGWLQLLVIPWAEVSVDDRRVGTTPMRALELPAGTHSVRLSHPDYGLLLREVSIQHGETTRLEVDLSDSTRP
jgi:serine/threonine-protein kinase